MSTPILTRTDFSSDQEVRWCPGCGDYAILAAVQRLAPELGIPKEKFVFVSGIGCSSRFPYYMNTYGFHTIHGRALTIATGLKCTRPELSVWVVTGDGDALSIGGNHFIHALRRNVDINVLLFNNRIYGLTKGQYSPTSEQGKRTKSTPMGSIDHPINAISLALASEATFVARSIDVMGNHLKDVLKQAVEHKGVSVVEIYQNCNIFNDGAFKAFTDKAVREDRLLELEAGKPLTFGKERSKGIAMQNCGLTVVENDGKQKLVEHDPGSQNIGLQHQLAALDLPSFPVPIGVFRNISRPTYNDLLEGQVEQAGQGSLDDLQGLLKGSQTWNVE